MRTQQADLALNVFLLGVAGSVLIGLAGYALGMAAFVSFTIMTAGLNLSIIAGNSLRRGRHISLLLLFALFLVASLELGLIVYMTRTESPAVLFCTPHVALFGSEMAIRITQKMEGR